MAQTYTGHFLDDGRFIPDGIRVKMPTQFRAIVSFLDEDKPTADTSLHQRQVLAVKRFLAAANEPKDDGSIMTDADWDDIDNIRTETNAGLSREIEL